MPSKYAQALEPLRQKSLTPPTDVVGVTRIVVAITEYGAPSASISTTRARRASSARILDCGGGVPVRFVHRRSMSAPYGAANIHYRFSSTSH